MRGVLVTVCVLAMCGCGGGSGGTSANSARGTVGVDFTVLVNNQGPGVVSDGTNTCAPNTKCIWKYPAGRQIGLIATPVGSTYFNGWNGDCQGTGTCFLGEAGDNYEADKYVLAHFSDEPEAHPNFMDPALHGPAFVGFDTNTGAPTRLICTDCHGARLQGQGIAPACTDCHHKATTVVVGGGTPECGPWLVRSNIVGRLAVWDEALARRLCAEVGATTCKTSLGVYFSVFVARGIPQTADSFAALATIQSHLEVEEAYFEGAVSVPECGMY